MKNNLNDLLAIIQEEDGGDGERGQHAAGEKELKIALLLTLKGTKVHIRGIMTVWTWICRIWRSRTR